ncbi:type VII secretion target [Micromonospora sp. WMMD882]|uniref:type VII secretion target n=1 Tax=Micromonospora sp. WMMD882 TaxID=3015151 RepID=UPI00248B6D80|nr:type VII secretion target [Micromonospora sp. WMMD882]WBB82215.1 type VII secretion target [Micromonospora sp. WMMD882]
MSDAAGLTVPPEALTRHARDLDAIAAGVGRAVAAAGQVRLGGEAYGRLCAGFPTLLAPLHTRAEEALRQARDALDDSARSVRAADDRYTQTDSHAADRFGSPR